MNSEECTGRNEWTTSRVYQLLNNFDIPVFDYNYGKGKFVTRDVRDIVRDMCKTWCRCGSITDSRELLDAVKYICGSDEITLPEEQRVALDAMEDEQRRMELQAEPDTELEDFLSGFHISPGGDAP